MCICGKASGKMGAGKVLQGVLQSQQVWVKNSAAVRADNMLTHMFAKTDNRPISNAFQMEAGASSAFQRRAVKRPYRASLDFGAIEEIVNERAFPSADFGNVGGTTSESLVFSCIGPMLTGNTSLNDT